VRNVWGQFVCVTQHDDNPLHVTHDCCPHESDLPQSLTRCSLRFSVNSLGLSLSHSLSFSCLDNTLTSHDARLPQLLANFELEAEDVTHCKNSTSTQPHLLPEMRDSHHWQHLTDTCHMSIDVVHCVREVEQWSEIQVSNALLPKIPCSHTRHWHLRFSSITYSPVPTSPHQDSTITKKTRGSCMRVRVWVYPGVQLHRPAKNPYPPSGYRFLAGPGPGTSKSTRGLPVQFTTSGRSWNFWRVRPYSETKCSSANEHFHSAIQLSEPFGTVGGGRG
jgi:hypothetical protein